MGGGGLRFGRTQFPRYNFQGGKELASEGTIRTCKVSMEGFLFRVTIAVMKYNTKLAEDRVHLAYVS